MTNDEIENRIFELVARKRTLTRELLELVCLAEKRDLPLERGYSNTYQWLVRKFGLSHSAAYRRIQASRLLDEIPGLGEKLESGVLNLSVVAHLRNAAYTEERKTGRKVSREEKISLLSQMEGKSIDAAERILKKRFPERGGTRQSLRRIGENESRLNIVIHDQCRENLERARDVLGHIFPDGHWVDVIDFSVQTLLEDRDPLEKSTHQVTATVTTRVTITPALRAFVLQRADGQCEFIHEDSGHRCEETRQLEVDHIDPKCLGGSNDPENLRALCRAHNQYESRRILGPR